MRYYLWLITRHTSLCNWNYNLTIFSSQYFNFECMFMQCTCEEHYSAQNCISRLSTLNLIYFSEMWRQCLTAILSTTFSYQSQCQVSQVSSRQAASVTTSVTNDANNHIYSFRYCGWSCIQCACSCLPLPVQRVVSFTLSKETMRPCKTRFSVYC